MLPVRRGGKDSSTHRKKKGGESTGIRRREAHLYRMDDHFDRGNRGGGGVYTFHKGKSSFGKKPFPGLLRSCRKKKGGR